MYFCIVFIQLICFLIRDLAKICWGIRENSNHIERKRDLNATREAGFTKILARDVRLFFFPLSIRNSVNRKMRNLQIRINRFVIWRGYEKLCQNIKRIKRANLRVNFWLLQQLVFFNEWKQKRDSGKWWKKCGMRDFREKEQKCGIRTSCTRSLWYFNFYIY